MIIMQTHARPKHTIASIDADADFGRASARHLQQLSVRVRPFPHTDPCVHLKKGRGFEVLNERRKSVSLRLQCSFRVCRSRILRFWGIGVHWRRRAYAKLPRVHMGRLDDCRSGGYILDRGMLLSLRTMHLHGIHMQACILSSWMRGCGTTRRGGTAEWAGSGCVGEYSKPAMLFPAVCHRLGR
jgi:hypothetical protein